MFYWIKSFTRGCQSLNRPPLPEVQAVKRENSHLKAQRASGGIPGISRRVIFDRKTLYSRALGPSSLPEGEAARGKLRGG